MSDDEMAAPQGGGLDMESNFPLDDMSNYDPLEVGQERDVSADKDGGVVKKLLVRGEGFKTPEKGDEVTGARALRGAAWLLRVAARRAAADKERASVSAGSALARRATARRSRAPPRRSALRRHAAGRERVRQQPRARPALRLQARHKCAGGSPPAPLPPPRTALAPPRSAARRREDAASRRARETARTHRRCAARTALFRRARNRCLTSRLRCALAAALQAR